MKELNLLESALIESIVTDNKEKYPFLNLHIPFLYVSSRDYTGVGSYSNFEYTEDISPEDVSDSHLSSQRELTIEGLKYELSYEIAITNGKIHYLEIVINGDKFWNGEFKNFKLT